MPGFWFFDEFRVWGFRGYGQRVKGFRGWGFGGFRARFFTGLGFGALGVMGFRGESRGFEVLGGF